MQVRPLRRQLEGLKAWITGQRKDQSPGTRQAVPVVQVRGSHLKTGAVLVCRLHCSSPEQPASRFCG